MLTRWLMSASRLLMLDVYASAAAAFSLRKLSSAYAGSAIRIRRSSDSLEQDIGFTGDELNVSAMLSFVGAGDGFVTTWYDQSGNSRHATQSTAANQPQVVSSGAVLAMSGKPTITFVDSGVSATKLGFSNWHAASTQHVWMFCAYRLHAVGNSPYLIGTNAADRGILMLHSGGGGAPRVATVRGSVSAYNFASNRAGLNTIVSIAADRTSLSGWVNGTGGVVGSDSNTDFQMPTNYEITDGNQAASNGTMSISELILYASDQSSARTGIESAINSYYGIY